METVRVCTGNFFASFSVDLGGFGEFTVRQAADVCMDLYADILRFVTHGNNE